MTNLPNCPICGENELWLTRDVNLLLLACYECGWHVTLTLATGQDLDAAIAATVNAYAAWLARAQRVDPDDQTPTGAVIATLLGPEGK